MTQPRRQPLSRRPSASLALHPLTLALLMASGQVVAADETTPPASTAPAATSSTVLDPVVVTTRRGRDTNTVVRAQRIEVEQAVNLQDLFKQTPEVTASGGVPAAQKLYVRGLGERMLTITIDGAAQAEAAYHHASQVMIEPELLKRIEIEAGTGAATAGPGALAGALRFKTKSALDLLRPGERAGALLKGSYQSVNDGKKASATVFGRLNDQVDLLVNATELRTDVYDDGNGNAVPNSSSEGSNAFLKGGARVGEDSRLEFTYEKRDDEGLRSNKTNLLPAAFNPSQRQRAERESATLNFEHAPDNPLLALHATAYINKNTIALDPGAATGQDIGSKTQGLNVSNVSKLGSHTLTYGYDHRRDVGFALTAGTQQANEEAQVHGIYLQDDIALTDRWQLELGARYDNYRYTDMLRQTYKSDGVSPSAGLSFFVTENLTLRVGHAHALRGVGIIEPFLKQFQTNATEIEAEKARTSEIGAAWQSGPWQAALTVYRQEIRNYIGYDDVRANMGDVKANGYSASAGYKADRWGASLGLSETKPKLNGAPLTDGDSLLLGNSTGRTWVAQFDQRFPGSNLSVGWTGRLIEKLTHVPEGAPEKSGYNVHDVYAQWLPLGRDDLTLTLTVKNLFDRHYYEQGSFGYHPRWGTVAGFPEAGRDIRATVALRF